MKLLFYSLHTEKQTTSRLSQTSFLNVVLRKLSLEHLGILGEVGVTNFRNAIGENYLSHSSKYVAKPSIEIVRQWFLTIGYGEAVEAKGTLKNSLFPH
ncbi:hypothetical protein Tco_0347040, partial [Tanacetum coccineum]